MKKRKLIQQIFHSLNFADVVLGVVFLFAIPHALFVYVGFLIENSENVAGVGAYETVEFIRLRFIYIAYKQIQDG